MDNIMIPQLYALLNAHHSVVIIYQHAKIYNIMEYIPYAMLFPPLTNLFYNGNFGPLYPLHLFQPTPHLLSYGKQQSILCVYESFYLFVHLLFFRFHM